jgi:hypothetical protein
MLWRLTGWEAEEVDLLTSAPTFQTGSEFRSSDPGKVSVPARSCCFLSGIRRAASALRSKAAGSGEPGDSCLQSGWIPRHDVGRTTVFWSARGRAQRRRRFGPARRGKPHSKVLWGGRLLRINKSQNQPVAPSAPKSRGISWSSLGSPPPWSRWNPDPMDTGCRRDRHRCVGKNFRWVVQTTDGVAVRTLWPGRAIGKT